MSVPSTSTACTFLSPPPRLLATMELGLLLLECSLRHRRTRRRRKSVRRGRRIRASAAARSGSRISFVPRRRQQQQQDLQRLRLTALKGWVTPRRVWRPTIRWTPNGRRAPGASSNGSSRRPARRWLRGARRLHLMGLLEASRDTYACSAGHDERMRCMWREGLGVCPVSLPSRTERIEAAGPPHARTDLLPPDTPSTVHRGRAH